MKQLVLYILICALLVSTVSAYQTDRVDFSPKKNCQADVVIDINNYDQHSEELVRFFFPFEIEEKGKVYYSPEEQRLYFSGVSGTIDIKEQEITCFDNKRSIVIPSPESHLKYVLDNQLPERLNIESKAAYGVVIYEKPETFACNGSAKLSVKNIHLATPNECKSYLAPFDYYKLEFGFNFENATVSFIVEDSEIEYKNYEIGMYNLSGSFFIEYGNVINFSKYNDDETFLNIKLNYKAENLFLQLVFVLFLVFVALQFFLSLTLFKHKITSSFFIVIPLIFESYNLAIKRAHAINLFDFLMVFWFLILLVQILVYIISSPKHQANLIILKLNKRQDLRMYTFPDTGWIRKFANLHIKNDSNVVAKRCIATLRILNKPRNINHLEREYSLHWAGIDYNSSTTGAQPIDLGKETRRLDLVFTQEGFNNGCWIAIPVALFNPEVAAQAYLPPGKYTVEVEVSYEKGRSVIRRYSITSPKKWEQLDISETT